jgi:uncharacterized protein YceK
MRTIIWPLAVAGIVLAGCSGVMDAKDSKQQVAIFHQRLDAGDYAAIYKASGAELKTAATEQDFTRLLQAVHTKLGKVKSAELQGTNIFAGTNGKRTTLTYATQFERGTGTETFVYAGATPAPLLVEYSINSTDMMIN